jgi:hypothetical protein
MKYLITEMNKHGTYQFFVGSEGYLKCLLKDYKKKNYKIFRNADMEHLQNECNLSLHSIHGKIVTIWEIIQKQSRDSSGRFVKNG